MKRINTQPLAGLHEINKVRPLRVVIGWSLFSFTYLFATAVLFVSLGKFEYWWIQLGIIGVFILCYLTTLTIKDLKKPKGSVEEFVRANNMVRITDDIKKELCPPSVPRGKGYSVRYFDGYQLMYDNVPVYLYKVESTYFDDKHGINYEIAVVRTNQTLPHVYLDSTQNGKDAEYKSWQRLSLEGDFDRHFMAYSEEGRHIDTLAFLAPDVMARLIDSTMPFDVELYGDKVAFISHKVTLLSQAGMDALDVALDAVLPKLEASSVTYEATGMTADEQAGLKRNGRAVGIIIGYVLSLLLLLLFYRAANQ